MPNLIPKSGIITTCVYGRGGKWQLSCRGYFFGNILTALSYQGKTRIPAKLDTIKDASPISVCITPMPVPASPKTPKGFDYTSLDVETSQFVQEQTGEIRGLMKRTAQGIVEIGQKLIEVKEKLGHGQFLTWLEIEFEWHRDTANKFMQVARQFGSLDLSKVSAFDISALYKLAAPSTPDAAREEAIARAEAGESITYTNALAIKQKYAALPAKSKSKPEPEPKLEPVSHPQPQPTPALSLELGSKLEIVAIHPQGQAAVLEDATKFVVPQTTQAPQVPQPAQPAFTPDVPGVWWRLGGRHLLYCGDPNSPEFLARITEQVQLLLAFPSTPNWQTAIQATTRIISTEDLPQRKNLRLFEDALETNLLLCSDVGELVVSCFLPSPEILSVINRQDRRGLFAEPDTRRVNAVLLNWKKAGLKVERQS